MAIFTTLSVVIWFSTGTQGRLDNAVLPKVLYFRGA